MISFFSHSVMWFDVGVKAKVGSNPFIKCATQYPLILWHPYARHHYFCVTTEKEQKKWHAVLQDCVRHSNNGMKTCRRAQTPPQLIQMSSGKLDPVWTPDVPFEEQNCLCLCDPPRAISSCLSHCWHFRRGCVWVCVSPCEALHAISMRWLISDCAVMCCVAFVLVIAGMVLPLDQAYKCFCVLQCCQTICVTQIVGGKLLNQI